MTPAFEHSIGPSSLKILNCNWINPVQNWYNFLKHLNNSYLLIIYIDGTAPFKLTIVKFSHIVSTDT